MAEVFITTEETTTAPALAAGPMPTPGGPLSYLHWGPAFAGAVIAAAAFFVLMTFAVAVGLMIASPAPTWRDTSVWLAILSGVWVLVVAVGTFGLGGYIAGRVRSSWRASDDEIEFRDGAHGLLVWGLGVILGAALAWGTAMAISTEQSPTTNPRGAVTTEPRFIAFEIDRLFRSERAAEPVAPEARAEAGRILLTSAGRDGITGEDRTYLNRLVAAQTGLGPPQAEQRVGQVLGQVQQSVRQARRSAVILGFMTAASLAAAAGAAWFAAGIGGRHRDQEIAPPLRWNFGQRA